MERDLIIKRLSIVVTTVFLVFLVRSSHGAFLENIPITLTQPDGSEVKCFASGDEYFNYAHDEDGYTIIVGEDGFYYYGIRDGEEVIPSGYRVDIVDPRETDLTPGARISERLYQQRRAAYEVPLERNDTRAPHTGVMNNIVIYIRFADDSEFTRTRAYYDTRFNNPDGISVRDYFLEVSYDQLEINSHHYPECDMNTNLSYQDIYPRSHFQPYHAVNNPDGYQTSGQRRRREHSLLVRAVEGVRDEIPEDLVIDASGDGRVDNVSFIIRGNAGAWADLLWAHRWRLHTYTVRIHGKRVYDYTFQPENQTGVRTLAHEMFHTLGAPDLYRYSHDGFVPVGPWDLMASRLVHMGAWMKYKYADRNWIEEIPEITSSGEYSLSPLTSPDNNSYMIRSPYSNREFFVLEYRSSEGRYESGVPGSGLLVYRINARVDGNASGPPDEVYIYRPNGTPTVSGSINLAAFSSLVNRTEINDYDTNPTSFLSNGNPGGLHIYDIGEPGEEISFQVTLIGDLIAPIHDRPLNNAADVVMRPTFEWGFITVADYYNLQVAVDSTFSELVVDQTEITETQYTLDFDLDLEQTYYWRVSSSDEEETSDWSDPWRFTVAHFSPLAKGISGASYGDIAWGDFNNNGFLDLLLTGESRTVLFKNTGDGELEELDLELPPLNRSSAAVGDVNNNGYLDIVLSGRTPAGESAAYICINEGDFQFHIIDDVLKGAYYGNAALGDYNNNGLLDIFICGSAENERLSVLFENQGNNSFEVVETALFPGVIFGDAVWGDMNNNGRLDILLTGTSSEGNITEVFYNNGDGTFTPGDAGLPALAGSAVSVADYNKNGFLDILMAGNSPTGRITAVYRNNGDGTFTGTGYDLPGIAMGDVEWGDFNGDGYPDILLAGTNRSAVFRNNNGEYFSEVATGLGIYNYGAVSWGDFNNDRFLDIAILGSGSQGSRFEIYQNNLGDDEFIANISPPAPQNPRFLVSDCTVTLQWDSPEMNGTSRGITYNLSIGTKPGKEDYLSSMSALDSGFRKIPAVGNAGALEEIILYNLPMGDYYWRVQAVDNSFAGSLFTEEKSFSVTTVSVEDSTAEPLTTKLHANYPNPFNPETTIRFYLAENDNVKLEIFNILGQKTDTLVDDILPAGEHSVVWNAEKSDSKNHSSGIYFYKLQTSDYEAIRKMLLLK